MYSEYDDVPGTWAYEYDQHWKAFNACIDHMIQGENGKMNRLNFRENVLQYMQERHEEEVNGNRSASSTTQ